MSHDIIDRSSRYFIQVPNDLIHGIKNANAYLVYSILKTHTNKGTNFVFPSRETIAQYMGVKTTKPVDQALKVLADLGLVATFPRWMDGSGRISKVKTEDYNRQTSNGYIIYDRINPTPPRGWDDPLSEPPKVDGVGSQKATPPGGQMEAPRVAEKVHEVYPLEVHPVEVDKRHDHPKDDRFNEFWEVVPKKVGKQAARKAWAKAIKATDPDVIIAGMKRYRDDPNRSDAFTKNPQGWLNDGRWEDDPLPDRSTTTSGKKANTVENWLGLPEGALGDQGFNGFTDTRFDDPFDSGVIDGTVVEQKELY